MKASIGFIITSFILFFRGCIPSCPDASFYYTSPERDAITGTYILDEKSLSFLKKKGYTVTQPVITLGKEGGFTVYQYPQDGSIIKYARGFYSIEDSSTLSAEFKSGGKVSKGFFTQWMIGHREERPVIFIQWGDPDSNEYIYYVKKTEL